VRRADASLFLYVDEPLQVPEGASTLPDVLSDRIIA